MIMRKKRTLFLSYMIWEEVAREANKRYDDGKCYSAWHLKDLAVVNLVKRGILSRDEEWYNHCPCCDYVVEKYSNLNCKKCPGKYIWHRSGKFNCERKGPYEKVMMMQPIDAAFIAHCNKIRDGFGKALMLTWEPEHFSYK